MDAAVVRNDTAVVRNDTAVVLVRLMRAAACCDVQDVEQQQQALQGQIEQIELGSPVSSSSPVAEQGSAGFLALCTW